MLHRGIRSPGPLGPKYQGKLHVCWKQFIRRVVCLSTQRIFNAVMGQNLKAK